MSRPNIIVIMADQMKATASHLWGSRFNVTPNIERLAENGVIFHNAFTPQPLCVPARVALWSGRWPHNTGARTNQHSMPGHVDHAFKIWKGEGYQTGLIGKNHCFREPDKKAHFDVWCEISHKGFENGSSTMGMEWWRDPKSVHAAHAVREIMESRRGSSDDIVEAETFSYGITDFPEADYGTGVITGQVEKYLEEKADEPFALWVSYPDPHTPYEAPRRLFDEMVGRVKLPRWRLDEFDDAPERLRVLMAMMDISTAPMGDLHALLACYHAMVTFIDEGVGRILSTLDRTGFRENTIVVFCADHGDFAGEHMMAAKGGAFFDCLTRIPLIISWPNATRGRAEVASPVNLIDVVPTLLALQGLPVPDAMDGQPLPVLTNAPHRRRTFSAYGNGGPPFRMGDLANQSIRRGRGAVAESLRRREWEGSRMMVVRDQWKYVHDPMGDEDELYDRGADPEELYNLAQHQGMRGICAGLRNELREWNPEAFCRAADVSLEASE